MMKNRFFGPKFNTKNLKNDQISKANKISKRTVALNTRPCAPAPINSPISMFFTFIVFQFGFGVMNFISVAILCKIGV